MTRLATEPYVTTESGLLIPKSILDAKGDLIVASANDTPAKLSVGTDGQVLTADSTQANGVKWSTPPSPNDYKKFMASFGPRNYWPLGDASLPALDYMVNYPNEIAHDLANVDGGTAGLQQSGPPVGGYGIDVSSLTNGLYSGATTELGSNADFSLFCWLKRTGTDAASNVFMAIGSNNSPGGAEMYIDPADQSLVGGISGITTFDSNYIIPINTWISACFVKQGTTNILYAAGRQRATNTNSMNGSATFTVGARVGGSNQPGWTNAKHAIMAHAAVFKYAISEMEYQQLTKWRP